MKTVRLPRSTEGALEVLIEDHRRMSFLEAHGGTISHGENGFRTWCPGSSEKPDDFPCIFTEGFPTVRASISDAMSQVEARRLERAQERRRWVELRRMISGSEAGGK